MYNHYKNGTQAWWAMKEAIQAETDLEDAVGNAASTMESIIEDFDDACQQRDDAEDERDQAQADLEEAKAKLEVFNPEEIINRLNDIEFAAAAVVKYCVKTRMDIREAYNVPESNSDSSDGDSGDGSGQADNESSAKQDAPEGK